MFTSIFYCSMPYVILVKFYLLVEFTLIVSCNCI
uniref:Uncharacterized protein n=1 Tax=Rhizophora mucronata TaxID=61149 RepID=A0A2P2IN33_RHIMU